MTKQSLSASSVIALSLAASKADATLAVTTVQWVNATLDALSATVARDKSGGEVARREVRKQIVEACLASETMWSDDKACAVRLPARTRKVLAETAKKKPMDVIEAVLGKSRKSTWYAYLSGISAAYKAGEWWTTNYHTTTEKAPADTASTPTAVAETTVAVKADKKARTVTVQAGAKATVSTEDVEAILSVLVSDPGRIALALAWIKSHGWTK